VKPRGRLRRIIATLHDWAESGWAGTATATWGVLQGSVVPGPSDVLLVPLGLADPPRVFRLAAWATLGSAAGGLIAYAIGALAFDTVGQWMIGLVGLSAERVQSQRARFEEHGAWLVALSAISPLPTKIVCIAAGAFGVPVPAFALAISAGRATRFFGLAVIVRLAGEWVMRKLGQNDS
jgi:membrane protein YqaA with SNARE-associated domain